MTHQRRLGIFWLVVRALQTVHSSPVAPRFQVATKVPTFCAKTVCMLSRSRPLPKIIYSSAPETHYSSHQFLVAVAKYPLRFAAAQYMRSLALTLISSLLSTSPKVIL